MHEDNYNHKGMRIGIDARLWKQTGVGRYIKNICINLSKIDKKNEYVLFVRSEDKNEIENAINNSNWKFVTTNIKWHGLKEQIKFPKVIKKEKVDLMHFPYFSVPIFYKSPFVITIHDLILHHFMSGKASTLPIWLYGFKMLSYKIVLNSASKRARKIISVSNTTKEEIFDHLVVNKNKVEVVYESADDFNISNPDKLEIGKYFLYVGNVYPHKNVDNLIKAFKNLAEKKDVKLIFIGKEDFLYKNLKKSVSKLVKQEKIEFIQDVDDKNLASYYANSVCLLRPSLMEGFSLPPLEALSVGGLVLASDIPVHKEIFGDSIFYFNPKDYVDMEKKMNYVLDLDVKTRAQKIKEGKLLAKKFSWEKAARETLRIYESSARL